MNKLFSKIAGLSIGLAMAIGVGVAVGSNSKEAAPAHATTIGTTYTVSSTAATSITNNGMYVLKSNADANGFTGTIASNWAKTTTTSSSYFILKAVGSTSSFTLEDYDGTNGYIYCSAAKKIAWHASSKTTFKLMTGKKTTSISNAVGNDTVGTLQYNSSGGFRPYTSATGADAQLFAVSQASVAAYVAGNSSVDANSEYTATVKKTSDDSTVSGTITYVYTPSEGAVLSSPTPDAQGKGTNTTGKFTASHSGKVTISATLSGYTITSKTVTVNSSDPYINLTLTSGATAYTGQTVSISADYGNGVAGLNWSIQSGSVTSPSGTNSGYTAKIAGSTGTLTIRATDTGSSLYSEVSVSVTKTAFTTSPAATATVAEGKTTTLSAALNSGGTINWTSDDTGVATVTATGGSVTVTGVTEGTATITATSADDTSVYAECDVTVTAAPSEVVITAENIENFSNSYTERNWTYGSGTSAISGKIKAYKNSSNIQVNSNNSCYVYNTDAIKGYITGITFTKVSGSKELTCYVGTSAITSNPSSGGSANTTYTWSFDPNDHYTYFRVSTEDSNGAIVASAITITYQKVQTVNPTGITLDDSSTVNMDSYGYGRRRLTATVEPFNANDKTVTWGTSDSSVVTVENGVLTPTGVGTTTVYATTANFVSDVQTPDLKVSVTVNVTEALYRKATFVPTSTSAATQTDDYLPDGSVSVTAETAGQYDNDKHAIQLASGKDVIFTISGYAGMKISGIDLVVSSNGAAGSGALTVTAGSTQIFAIASAAFSDETWNGAYDANACDLYRATTEYVVEDNETIKFAFSASANSLYVHSVAIRYLDYSLEQWCESFLTTITCDGVGSITDDSKWDDLGLEFLDLSEELRNLAAAATANKDSESIIEQAMARYDLIIRKYGTSAHDEFIGRFGPGTVNGPLGSALISKLVSSSGTSIAIIAISAVSLAAIGGYFLFRKKKED